MPTRIAAYVDGFNLYHGLHDLSGRRDLWLDIESLLNRSFVDPARNQQLVAVHYFTAAVHGPGRQRQDVYLKALEAHGRCTEVHLGRMEPRPVKCYGCGNVRTTYEEKESDVSLAVQLVQDAALGAFDRALLVSADSDMCPAVRAAQTVAPTSDVVAIFPPRRNSDHLRKTANVTLRLFDRLPRRHQLPAVITGQGGTTLNRPSYWS